VRWERKGIVVPAPPPLSWARSHAALPIPRNLPDGRTELYFSTRDKYRRSHVARAIFEGSQVFGAPTFSAEPVLRPGPRGSFDDAGVTTSCLVEFEGRLLLYYSGWTLGVSVPFYFFVGCAASDDGGNTFVRLSPSPILERNDVDPYLTASPWVIVEDGLWRMWYVSGTGWELRDEKPVHRYHIKYAESRDGLSWARDGHICIDYRDELEFALARPCVIREDGWYRMWFSARGEAYRLGYAESRDGLTWDRRDENVGLEPSSSGWDSEMLAYPVVFTRGSARYLLYNGNGYGATGIGAAVAVGE
jgi:hypothetical protein